MRDLFGVEIAAPYAGHNEVSFNFGTVLSRVPGLSRRKGADLKVPDTYAAHVCLYKYSASRKNKRLTRLAYHVTGGMCKAMSADLPSWIQALAALSLVILTFLTLIVLRKYAADTKKIANVSASQTESSQMPFLAVVMRPETYNSSGGWGIENQGFGRAINVSYSSSDQSDAAFMQVEPIAKGGVLAAHADIADAFSLRQRLVIRYESLSGAKYRTTVTMVENVMQTQFQKLPIR